MKLVASKPKMLRVMNTSLLGGLLSASNIQVDNSSITCSDSSLQTVVSWSKFDETYFDNFIVDYKSTEIMKATDSLLKAMKDIKSSDIELTRDDKQISLKGSSFKYSESEQTPTGTTVEVDEKTLRPSAVANEEIVSELDIDIEELQKIPSADKYTFCISSPGDSTFSFKVTTSDVGTLEIDLKSSNGKSTNVDYKKSFSGDMFEKIISNFDGKVHVEFGDKFLIISSVTPGVKLMFAQASLVDSATVTV